MMRALACLVLFAGLVGPLHADEAAQAERIPRIGYLATHAAWTRYFHATMKDLGYLEGKNLIVVWRLSDERADHLATAAQELVALDVDLIFVDSTPGALAAKGATLLTPCRPHTDFADGRCADSVGCEHDRPASPVRGACRTALQAVPHVGEPR
jgi:hypothetical protein